MKNRLFIQLLLFCLGLLFYGAAFAQEKLLEKDLLLHRKKDGLWYEEFQVLKKDTSIKHGYFKLKIGAITRVIGEFDNGQRSGVWKTLSPDGSVYQIYNFLSGQAELFQKEPLKFELSFDPLAGDSVIAPIAILPLEYVFRDELSSFPRNVGTSQMKILIGVDENSTVTSLDVVYISKKKTETKSYAVGDNQKDQILTARINGKPVKCLIVFSVLINVMKDIKYPAYREPPSRRLPSY